MRRNNFILILIVGLCAIGCKNVDLDKTIAFEEQKSFYGFPHSVELDSGMVVETNTIGNLEFRVCDSLMVISTREARNSWKILSLRTDSLVLECVNVGGGPNEFSMPPLVSQASFMDDGGVKYVIIPDNIKRKRCKMDLSASVDSGYMVGKMHDDAHIDNFTIIDTSVGENRMMVSVKPSEGMINRTLLKGDSETPLKAIEHLNAYKVPDVSMLGLLIPHIVIDNATGRAVEVMELYPQINLYDLDGSFSLSLLPEGELGSYRQYAEKGKLEEIPPQIYRGVNGYDEFFVINKVCEQGSELWFISWTGEPLLDLKLPERMTSFDIDMTTKTLYTLDFQEDIFRKYDLAGIFEECKM